MPVAEITVEELHRQRTAGAPLRLIDVREPDEWEVARVEGAELLPLSQWPALAQAQLTEPDEPLFIMCHHGGRSARAAEFLAANGFTAVTNVTGGIDAWSLAVDPTVPRY